MRVLACGDRNWDDLFIIERVLAFLGPNDTLINGCARGADTLAAWAASENGCKLEDYPADWNTHKKAAGPIRNQQMLDEGKPELVFAFHSNLQSSKGTKDMVKRAVGAGIPVYVISRQFYIPSLF